MIEKLQYYQSQNWKNDRQPVGKEKPSNQTETTWRWDILMKAAHQSVRGHEKDLRKACVDTQGEATGLPTAPILPSELKWEETRALSSCPCQLWIRRDYCCQSIPPTDCYAHCCHYPNLLLTICVLMCHWECVSEFLRVCIHSLSTKVRVQLEYNKGN